MQPESQETVQQDSQQSVLGPLFVGNDVRPSIERDLPRDLPPPVHPAIRRISTRSGVPVTPGHYDTSILQPPLIPQTPSTYSPSIRYPSLDTPLTIGPLPLLSAPRSIAYG